MIKRLYTPRYVYETDLDQKRANGLQLLVLILLALLALLTVGLIAAQSGLVRQSGALLELTLGLSFGLFVLAASLIAIFVLLQRGALNWASWIMVGLLLLGTLIPITNYEFEPIYLIIPLVAAAVLLDRRGLFLTLVLISIGILARYSAVVQDDTPIRIVPSREIPLLTFQTFNIIFFIAALLFVFGSLAVRISRTIVRSFQRLQRVTSLTPQFAAETTEEALIQHLLQSAQDGLGYALVQLYLVDASNRVGRRIRRGAGQQPLISTMDMTVGETDVVLETVQTREINLVRASDGEPRARHLVAPARLSISLPLVFSNGRVAAVFDVQSVSTTPPDDNEKAVLLALAQSFSAAWEKLTLTSDQARVITDQAAQIERLREQIAVLEGRARQTVVASWDSYLHGRGEELIGFDLVRKGENGDERELRPASDLPPDLADALERGEPQIVQENDEQVILVPIRVRNAVLGAMAFRMPGDQTVTQRQMETARIVAERLGLALESTRLYEQYQAQARRERKASEVTGVLLGTTDLNALLAAAAGTFNEALGAVSTRVTIEPAAVAPPVTNGHHANGDQGGNR